MPDPVGNAVWRSLLYVPANRDRFVRSAVSSSADAVILDLEDAVPAEHKAAAREQLSGAVAALRQGTAAVLVRVNRPWTAMIPDLEAAVQAGVDGVIIPKSDDAGMIRTVDQALCELEGDTAGAPTKVIPLIESARGVRRVDEIVDASTRVIAASTGIGDLCLDLRASPDSTAVTHAFTEVVQATKAAGRTPLGLAGLIVSFTDIDQFRALAATSRAIGSTGASCIHPRQIGTLNEVFGPSPDEIDGARRVVSAYEEAAAEGRGSVMLGDIFIDNANYRYAKELLERV
ncbi:citrate lyase subunit beta / citryl-CoA lyase [Thermomonospora echinospora]|uniref:Citrate lyase subunit beta / citryl-CoA lyase n=1 Tax=Thermomonospora echinospora TaxID=1992 RepID=A0A1H6E541_9ACTN|nr:CoA ester lyase [Thermomonospora echinospora]SEG92810.1 citrate lyase subunit beta / citryl-CoA lyase [Thermomonospora echinospora]